MKIKIYPSKKAQERYPIYEYTCKRCKDEGLPFLVDNGCEFHWEHQHDPPGSSARSGCPRFGVSQFSGCNPRKGTAASRYKQDQRTFEYVLRTEEEYADAIYNVEEYNGDDAWVRIGIHRPKKRW